MAFTMNKIVSMLAMSSVFLRAMAVDGETGPDNSTTPTTASGEVTIHEITVGKVNNEFQPNSIQAQPGDIVRFHFYPSNHSVIRSAYGYPCIPYEDVFSQAQGFTSGPQSVNSSESPSTWNITVNNTEPVFFYCGAPGSCYGWGMLGVINANSNTDLSKQIAIARQEAYELWPGNQLPAAAAASLAAIAATATTSASASAAPASSSLSSGAIAGIVVGALVVLLGAIGVYVFMRRASQKKRNRSSRPNLQPIQVGTYQGVDQMQSPGFHPGMASPGLPTAQLPPYAASQDMKGPYGPHTVQYIQDPLHSPPLMTEHPSYFDYRNGTPPPGSPPPHGNVRMSIASELDGSVAHATRRSSPALGNVQELDSTQPVQQHELHS